MIVRVFVEMLYFFRPLTCRNCNVLWWLDGNGHSQLVLLWCHSQLVLLWCPVVTGRKLSVSWCCCGVLWWLDGNCQLVLQCCSRSSTDHRAESRVLDQTGISRPYNIPEIYHSGPEPSWVTCGQWIQIGLMSLLHLRCHLQLQLCRPEKPTQASHAKKQFKLWMRRGTKVLSTLDTKFFRWCCRKISHLYSRGGWGQSTSLKVCVWKWQVSLPDADRKFLSEDHARFGSVSFPGDEK